jgi:hypothetical protein
MTDKESDKSRYTPERRDVFGPGVDALHAPENNNWPNLQESELLSQTAIRAGSREHVLKCSREWERQGGGDDATGEGEPVRLERPEKD